MSDRGTLDVGDWLGIAVTSTIAGMGSAMAWFRASNKKRDRRIEDIGDKVEKYKELVTAQALELAVLQTCQANIQEKLEEIKEDIRHTAEKGAHSVNSQLAAVLNEVQKVAAHQQRRT